MLLDLKLVKNTGSKLIFSWLKFFLLSALLPFSTFAQDTSFRFKRLGLEDGLSQVSVNSIAQDANGFIWFATQDGLNKYDGYKITTYRHQPSDPNSIINNHIFAIFKDSRNNLWIGGYGGLSKYEPKTDNFTHYNSPSLSNSNGKSAYIQALFEDSDGELWLSSNIGLYRFNIDTNTYTLYLPDPNTSNSLIHDEIKSIAEDAIGNIWIGTTIGVSKYNKSDNTFTNYQHSPNNPHSLSNNFVWKIYKDSQNNLWFGTFGGGLDRYNSDTGKFIHHRANTQKKNSLGNNDIRAILEDSNGIIWLGTNNGLYAFDSSKFIFRRFKYSANDSYSLSHDVIYSLFQDKDGLLWAGTLGGGVNSFRPNTSVFKHYRSNPNNPESLNANMVYAIYDDDENVWVGTSGGGLNKLNKSTGKFSNFTNSEISAVLGSHKISYIIEASATELWLSTNSDGLIKYNKNTGNLTQYKHHSDDINSLSNDRARGLAKDKYGNLWIGTAGGGLNKLDVISGKFSNFMPDTTNSNSISTNFIRCLLYDSKGRLWTGSYGQGLNRFDLDTQTFINFNKSTVKETKLSNKFIRSIFEDSSGNIWVLTNGGIIKYDENKGSFHSYTTSDGLPSNVVYGALEDQNNNLWLSTNNGLSKFNPQNITFENYTKDDGIQESEFNTGSFFQNKKGEMYFGGINGFTLFHPENIKKDKEIPTVTFTNLLLYNDVIEVGDSDHFSSHISSTNNLNFSHDDDVITFEFSALSYWKAHQISYRYQLQGFSDNWIETDFSNRRATFTNLSKGDYILKVKASNRNGIWGETTSDLKISIAAAYWETTWFRGLLFAMGIIICIFAIKWRENALNNQNLVLDIMVKERTKELESSQEYSNKLENLVQERTLHLQKANAALEKSSITDALTGIRNRRFLDQQLASDWSIQSRNNLPLSILMIDVDFFKKYNDYYGHQQGDECLQKITKEIQSVINRPTDNLCRYGGEEFVVITYNDAEGARYIAKLILKKIDSLALAHFKSDKGIVSVSIGVGTMIPSTEVAPARLLAYADDALYQAKDNGRDQLY
ncbi:hypothetical protein CXF85_05930 [Colwellia sp. 75C3]|uniref:two-component regulator propeller domain-containing protein n=1 Tax=Colwellia sp. 75C3 TaxID=888425 RepID=UPI000C331FA6|nr:two-component regulator propeller domain-containing protein [Colwellia sp. 75C3]PKG85144.1 hypothetical protein CXF85_05930 [Colwellia sp. 75C3]